MSEIIASQDDRDLSQDDQEEYFVTFTGRKVKYPENFAKWDDVAKDWWRTQVATELDYIPTPDELREMAKDK